jgi:hypothetical protein
MRLWSRPRHLTRVELIYLPYYFFDVTLSQDGGSQHVGVAVDGVLGNTVFFVGAALTRESGADFAFCDFVESPSVAQDTALQEYRWLLLEHGLRNKRKASVQEISEPERVHYPFWVAYFKKRGAYDFKALDAVSGEIQGVKMRKVFLAAFRQMSKQ